MTIDEVIENEKRRAESCKGHYDRFVQMEAKEHKQIAEWLEELVMLRLDSCMIHMPERLHLVENGYNKGIDDFAEKMKYEYGSAEIHETIDKMAQQLKAGGKNEQSI